MQSQIQLQLLKEQIKPKNVKYQVASENRRRARFEIVSEILILCNIGTVKTGIMYGANLNYSQLQNQIEELTSSKLLVKDMGKYSTTEKGFHFLELYSKLNDILNTSS